MDISVLKSMVPLPDITTVKNAVFIGPHPDDIEIGAGGTVHKLIGTNTKVTFVICTDGGCGSANPNTVIDDLIRIRAKESQLACQKLQVNELRFLDFPDGGQYQTWDLAVKIAQVLAEIRPDIVFCPDPYLPSETHPDHIRCGKAAKTAVMMAGNPLVLKRNGISFDYANFQKTTQATLAYYYTHRPNCYVPLTLSNQNAKMQAINYHQSQFPGEASPEWMMVKTYLEMRQRAFGALVGSEFAEAFFVMAPVHQHCFPEVLEF
ncbi:MAG: PIG-L family deacetylase [Candidatus Izemoplasmatales bacterium]|jgi:LmbE family N-acetylglucosaminyl deacetylase|nr:PIG-L family deacetylase [Candidatus Izemoplasmatales bacterium]MDD3865904.1 PIG-L family deacetylase [Candidatus Izemoplasmatales bacterium]